MAIAEDICRAKASVSGARSCFDVNEERGRIDFKGCPACQRDARKGVTVEEAKADMEGFMRICRERQTGSAKPKPQPTDRPRASAAAFNPFPRTKLPE